MGQIEAREGACCVLRNRGTEEALASLQCNRRIVQDLREIDDGLCVGLEDAGVDRSRRTLFSEKSLRPKMLMLRGLREEQEALSKLLLSLDEKLSLLKEKPLTDDGIDQSRDIMPHLLIQQTLGEEQSTSEWARRILISEAHMKVLSIQNVEEAILAALRVQKSNVPFRDVKEHYRDILRTVQAIAQERQAVTMKESAQLRMDVLQQEDLIAACFSKMDQEGTGSVTRERFVSFVCGDDDDIPGGGASMTEICPVDAEELFLNMSRGREVITYEQFRDGITTGCLDVLKGNIDLRRVLLKRHRDCWL